MKRNELVRYLHDQPVIVDPATVEHVYEVARHRSTGQPKLVSRGAPG